jgi:hypothetical protein
MGYYVWILEADCGIQCTNSALAALKAMDTRFDHLKRGGRFGGDEPQERWFSWMPPDWAETANSAHEVFEMLGFNGHFEDEGIWQINGYDNKAGQEGLFLAVIAPWVTSHGSTPYIHWIGEDDEEWKQTFHDGRMSETHAEIIREWGTPQPYKYEHFTVDGLKKFDPYTEVTV